jgi:hypothetical protein
MFGKKKQSETRETATRNPFFGTTRIATRRRTAERQMEMFTIASVTGLAAMLLLPSLGGASASVEAGPSFPTLYEEESWNPLAPATEADRVCVGQAWGNEDLDCVLAIARTSGKGDRLVIRIASIAGTR